MASGHTALANDVELEIKAKWKDGTLVVERKFEGGAKIVEVYELMPGGREMHVSVKAEGGRMPRPMQFFRVYEMVEESNNR